ncbi:hypothetical protein ACOSP7_003380 [Xanthoceras sorbifolium]
MATYTLELWQNHGVLNRNHNWHFDYSGFQIELHVHHRNSGVLRPTRTFYWENQFLLSERGMRELIIRILLEELIPINSYGVQFIRHSPSGIPIPTPLYSFQNLVLSVLHTVMLMRNDPINRFVTLLPINLYIVIDEIRQLLLLNDSIILDGESLDRGLVQLQFDDSIILDGESSSVLLKEEKVEDFTDCSICLESISVGEIIARLPCSHLYHTTYITRWLYKNPHALSVELLLFNFFVISSSLLLSPKNLYQDHECFGIYSDFL